MGQAAPAFLVHISQHVRLQVEERTSSTSRCICFLCPTGEAVLSEEVAELLGDACLVEQLPGTAVLLLKVNDPPQMVPEVSSASKRLRVCLAWGRAGLMTDNSGTWALSDVACRASLCILIMGFAFFLACRCWTGQRRSWRR